MINSSNFSYWHTDKNEKRKQLGLLFEQFYGTLLEYGCKMNVDEELVKDNIQELFVEVWNQKKEPTIISIKAYLLKALRYKLIKQKKRNLSTVMLNDENDVRFDVGADIFLIEKENQKEIAQRIIDVLEKLPKRQREIIYLRFFLNLDYSEICDIMEIQYQVARNQLSNAIKYLKHNFILITTNGGIAVLEYVK